MTAAPAEPRMPPTVAEWTAVWMERRRSQVRPHTRVNDEGVSRNYVLPHLGDLRLHEVDRRTLERVYARLLAEGGRDGRPLASSTVRSVHIMVRSVLRDACQAGWIEENPAEKARPPRLDPTAVELPDDPSIWTGEQAAAFLRHVDSHRWRALWHLAVGTGARRGELVGLRWVDVRLDRAEVRIRRSLSVVGGEVALLPTKSARPRVLCIADSVVDAIARHPTSTNASGPTRPSGNSGGTWCSPLRQVATSLLRPSRPRGVVSSRAHPCPAFGSTTFATPTQACCWPSACR